jgi:hypothetical protein
VQLQNIVGTAAAAAAAVARAAAATAGCSLLHKYITYKLGKIVP